MSTIELDKIQAGFADPIRESQTAFRAIMEAFARPGTRADFGATLQRPSSLGTAAATVALALFDFETQVWLDPVLRGTDAEAWIRFHCGCPLTTDPVQAAFAIVTDAAAAPSLGAFNLGDARYPDRSTTVILQVASLEGGKPATLTGPGIKDQVVIAPKGLPSGFWGQMQDNNAKYQFGVDVLIVSGPALVAVPRSSHIQIQGD